MFSHCNEMDTGCSAVEDDEFKEYIKENIIMAVLRITDSRSVAICRLMKKSLT